MPTGSPLVSVITPSFMQGRFIGDCLESVRRQTYRRIEHLVYDACSVDETLEVVSGYLDTYNLTLVTEKDRGQAHAINKGLDSARGEIICWLNSDDLFYDEHVIEDVVNTFQRNQTWEIITGSACLVDYAGEHLRPIPVFDPALLDPLKFPTLCIVTQPATFWRRNQIRLNEDLTYAFDWQFWIDLSRSGRHFVVIDRCFAKYRMHGDAKTFMDTAERKKEVIYLNRYAGASRIAIAWSAIVYMAYKASEMAHVSLLKKIAAKINNIMGLSTQYRVFSQ